MKSIFCCSAAVVALTVSQFSSAAIVTLPTSGNLTVSYEDTQSSIVNGAYSINSVIDFNNNTGQIQLSADFGVAGVGGAGQLQAEEEVTFTITGANGFGISNVFVFEGGFYTRTGEGTVGQTGSLSVVNNAAFGATNNQGYGPTAPLNVVGQETGWTAQGGAAVQAFDPFAGFSIVDTTSDSITVTINNILFATAPTTSDAAQIEKNNSSSFVLLGVNAPPPAPVPVPAAAWFMLSGLVSLFVFRKKVSS